MASTAPSGGSPELPLGRLASGKAKGQANVPPIPGTSQQAEISSGAEDAEVELSAESWEDLGTAAWDPAAVWDAEDFDDAQADGNVRVAASVWVQASSAVAREQSQPITAPTEWVQGAASANTPPAPDELLATRRQRDKAAAAAYSYAYGYGAAAHERDGSPNSSPEAQPSRRAIWPWRELVIITAVAVLVAAVFLGVSNARNDNLLNSSGTTSPSTVPGAARHGTTSGAGTATGASSLVIGKGAASTATGAGAANKATPTTGARTTTSALSQRAKALPVTLPVVESLINSWIATKPGGYQISPLDISGTVANEAFYADQPATGTYWAVAEFKPSPALLAQSSTTTGQAELSEFKNSLYAFSWQSGPLWTLLGEVSSGSCPGIWVPRTVLGAWHLCGL
jgi:hypothetical protein